MAKKVKPDPFTAVYEVDGVQVFPMKWRDNVTVGKIFNQINPEWIVGNFCAPKVDDFGMPLKDETGEVIIDTKPQEALLELLKLATRLTEDEIDDLSNVTIAKIIEEYMEISSLKKKMMALQNPM